MQTSDLTGGLPRVEHSRGRPSSLLALFSLAGILIVSGCGNQNLASRMNPNAPRPTTAATAPVVSTDPVIAFAARAQPGQNDRVTLENGQSASVRLVRSYHAASGRECRELVVGAGLEERQRLICAGETGWSDARPLLRGGTVPR